MKITRRNFLTATGAAALAAGLPARVWSLGTIEAGNIRIDSLSDGHLVLSGKAVYEKAPQDELLALLKRHGIEAIPERLTPPCNVTLLRDGTHTVLFDTGSGTGFQDTVGELPDALDEIGVGLGDVSHVIFTHGHPDHLWGVLDDFDEPTFTEAEHMMGKVEFEYWSDPETLDRIDQNRKPFAAGAKRRLDLLGADFFTLFEGAPELLPGVKAHPTFGHSPGHCSYEITTPSGQVMVVGDALTNDIVAFERPGWVSARDQDGEMAAQTRLALLDHLSRNDITLIAYHIAHPGIGKAEKIGDESYRFVPLQG